MRKTKAYTKAAEHFQNCAIQLTRACAARGVKRGELEYSAALELEQALLYIERASGEHAR